MTNKKTIKTVGLTMAFIAGVIFGLFTIMLVSAVNVCCEKTTSDLWCQNTDPSNCDGDFQDAPTACDSTSYCKTGCCFDSQEGLCWENTPKQVCGNKGGSWADDSSCNIPQCSLGCCLLGDQGALVTLTRCKSMSGFYGLETDFRFDLTDELECISAAQSKDKGACVIEADFVRTCVFTTRESCEKQTVSVEGASITNTTTEFYEGILCSAEELGTDCGPSQDTILIEGKDEVYFRDSCFNPANIYDASRINDDVYWKEIIPKDESCGYESSNAASRSCGNCNYFLGSIGVVANRSTGYATYGDHICRDLNCNDVGKKHGESWCVYDGEVGDGSDSVGSRHYKNLCIFGQVLPEPCADFRNEICIENEAPNGFTESACRVNRWQDCTAVKEREDCENIDLRECKWIDNYCYDETRGGTAPCVYTEAEIRANGTVQSITGEGIVAAKGMCVPAYPPGLQFWNENGGSSPSKTAGNGSSFSSMSTLFGTVGTGTASGSTIGSASSQCTMASSVLTVIFKKKETLAEDIFGSGNDWECEPNNRTYKNHDFCVSYFGDGRLKTVPDDWIGEMNDICNALGDCGGDVNWIGEGTEEGFAAYYENLRVAGAGGGRYLEEDGTFNAPSSDIQPGTAETAAEIAGAASEVGNINPVTGFIMSIIKKITGRNN